MANTHYQKSSDLRAFGLLHLAEAEITAVNFRTADFSDQISTYLLSATTLSNSLRRRGISFTLLTNNIDLITNNPSFSESSLVVREIPFTTSVPVGTRFYSAHFKLDVFRYFSTLPDE